MNKSETIESKLQRVSYARLMLLWMRVKILRWRYSKNAGNLPGAALFVWFLLQTALAGIGIYTLLGWLLR
jgi:hypothetical protein